MTPEHEKRLQEIGGLRLKMIDTSAIREEKDKDYGDPKVSLGAIGFVWGCYLETRWAKELEEVHECASVPEITADMVADLMMIMKIWRRANLDCPGVYVSPHEERLQRIERSIEGGQAIDKDQLKADIQWLISLERDKLSPLEDCGKDIAVYADIATECDARIDHDQG